MVEVALTLLLGGAFLGVGLLYRHKRLQGWQEAAVEAGLQAAKISGWAHRVTARTGPVQVTIEPHGNKGRHTRIIVWFPGPRELSSVSIHREPLIRWGRESEVGEVSFDSTFFLEGPTRMLLALLDAETRRLLLEANSVGALELSNGSLRVSDLSDEQVPHLLPLLVRLGQRLAQPMDALGRLTQNANHDPEPGVRLQNLLLLARELPGNPWTLDALRTACSDPVPMIRLRAAQELGAEGRGVLLDLTESPEADDVSAAAVAALARELPFERTEAILSQALRRRLVQTARACMDLLGASGKAAAVDVLAKVLALEQGPLAAAAAAALGATGSPAAEPPLIEALQREAADARVAAATALGRVGSAAAVLPLKEANERSWLDLDFRRASRQAIAEIQSRLQGASPGQLSLAPSEAGQLSLAHAETGQVSLAENPEGRMSLAQTENGLPARRV